MVTLQRTAQLERFLCTAADRGLEPRLAVRLALERALVLIDTEALGLDQDGTRRLLRAASARGGRVRRPLSPERAAYVRRLAAGRPQPRSDAGDPLSLRLPEDLIVRARGVVPRSALAAECVAEMIAWELAAALDSRTMAEWALLALAAAERPAALAC